MAFHAFSEDRRVRQHASRWRLAARAVSAQRFGSDAARPAGGSGARPRTFYRGYDVYDRKKAGFVSNVSAEKGKKYFLYDTALPGNGNGGHLYGTQLSPAEKDALVEYMKKL